MSGQMDSFAVVQVFLDYDYIEDVEYITRFSTKQEAESFISEKKKEQQDNWDLRVSYVNSWVDALKIPDIGIGYNEWQLFIKNNFDFMPGNIRPRDFKMRLKQYLLTYSIYDMELENYNPPPLSRNWGGLHIIEIKDL